MRKLLVSLAACACLLAASCAHNGFFVGRGKVLCINGSGLTYVNGIVASDMSRENTGIEVEFSDSDGIGNTTGTSQLEGGVKIRRRIGKQITGYLVDLAKVAPDAAKEYVVSGVGLEDVGQMERLPGYKGVGTAGEAPAKKDAEEADAPADDEGACETCGDIPEKEGGEAK